MSEGLKTNINKLKWQDIFYLILKTVCILTKTQKPIQMFQLGVGHSQMHPPLFYIPASDRVVGFVYNQETSCGEKV